MSILPSAFAKWPCESVLALGLFLVQLAWVVAVPPFSGLDEFDHAYRAAGVAHGQLVAEADEATRGTGAWLEVPENIFAAARPECESLDYMTVAGCRPSARDGDMVTVASGAGRYSPVYYVLVGWPSLFLRGDVALVAMRLLTVAASAGLFWAGLVVLGRGSLTVWPLVGATLAVSPVVAYSASVVAPNGVEIMAAIALWASLVVGVRRPQLLVQGPLLWAMTLSGVLLATMRQLGPLWLVAIVAFSLAAGIRSATQAWDLMRSRRVLLAAAVVTLAAVGGVLWTLVNRSLVVGVTLGSDSLLDTMARLPSANALWIFQSIAAFPLRNERAPTVVYFCFLVLWGITLVVALRRGGRRESRCAVLAGAASLVIASAVTLRTFNDFGVAWQGRYALPLAVGTGILAGLALERERFESSHTWIVAGGVVYGLGHLVSIVNVALRQISDTAGSGPVSGYVAVGAATGLGLVGVVLMGWALAAAHARLAGEDAVSPQQCPTSRVS